MREFMFILTGTFNDGRGGTSSQTITGTLNVNGHPNRMDTFQRVSDHFKSQFQCDGFVVTYFYMEENQI